MSTEQTRTLLAFLIIIVILFIWSLFSKPKSTPRPQESFVQDTIKTPVKTIEPKIISGDTVVIDKEAVKVILSTAGASVKSFYLKKYNIDIVPEGKYLFLSKFNNADSIISFGHKVYNDSVIFSCKIKGTSMKKIYYFNNNTYGFRLTTYLSDTSLQILSLKSGVRITETKNKGDDLRHFNVYIKDDKVNNVTKKIKDNFKFSQNWDWLGLRNKYFLLVINNNGTIDNTDLYKLNAQLNTDTQTSANLGCAYPGAGGGNRYGVEIIGKKILDVSVLLLPIKYSELASYKKGYEETASSGIWTPIARIILLIFNFFFSIFRNYGVAIIIFAILLKLAFFPLSRQMIISQHKMQMLQPELKKIQQKYKNEPQKLNQEMMHLYKTYKINPFSGCLPLLIQLPVFFALYQTLATSIEFRQANFALWLTDLSLKDPYYVLPIGMGIMMVVQSLLTPIDPRQRFMIILMPLVMIFVFLNLPSGLQLYWFTYNILTLVEHYITKKGGIK